MKLLYLIIAVIIINSCADGKEKSYTASTPANASVRKFLHISLTDSIDFIRWKITFIEKKYLLTCNYGIGKPNTNGFINGGGKIELRGNFEKEKDYYRLHNGEKILNVLELNNGLLHFTDENYNLLTGNAGWSYTLNNILPELTDPISIYPIETALKDSTTFEGRTPCGIPGIIPAGTQCYKLKWRIILYAIKK